MSVDSYLELFTTLFGWQWYGIVWDVLADTGIVLIPFVVLVIRTWRDAARGGAYGNVHELALRGLEPEFYVAIFVAIVTGPLTVTLNTSMLSYQASPDITDPSPPVATPTSSQSTYGNPGAFGGAPSAVQLLIWWYTVLALSKGINHAIMAGIPDSGNIRLVRTLYYPKMRAMRPVSDWAYDAARDADFDPSLPLLEHARSGHHQHLHQQPLERAVEAGPMDRRQPDGVYVRGRQRNRPLIAGVSNDGLFGSITKT